MIVREPSFYKDQALLDFENYGISFLYATLHDLYEDFKRFRSKGSKAEILLDCINQIQGMNQAVREIESREIALFKETVKNGGF